MTGPTSATPAGSVDEVVELLERWGPDPYGEELSQLDHALQSAALGVAVGADDALVVAALLHDVGHLLHLAAGGHPDDGGDRRHEVVGARWLGPLLGPEVTGPIALHVRAKRYLAATQDGYLEALSPASRRSLERQGGPLTAAEAAAFAARPGAAAAVELRRWDDRGKVDGLAVAPLERHRARLDRLARSAG